MTKVVIISSGQPSANPRAVKEAVLLAQADFEVSFIYCPLSPWADEFDRKLFKEHPQIKWIPAGYHPGKKVWMYRYARLRKKAYAFLNKYAGKNRDSNIRSFVLFSQELGKQALKQGADLYIAHNLGAIGAAQGAAEKHRAKFGFDAEDFHRGEFVDGDPQAETVKNIEEKYFPRADYFTAASPLIGKAYEELFPGKIFTVVNNVFSKKYSTGELQKNRQFLDLFWFSQFIGPKRGLETVIAAINLCREQYIRLHLLGNINNEYRQFLSDSIGDKSRICFYPPADPEQVFDLAKQFSIGLATEVPETLNRRFCLTNKIFTYLIAGNAMLLSDTPAQEKFLDEHPGIGLLYKSGNAADLAEQIKKLAADPLLVTGMRKKALQLASEKMNWEQEGLIFLDAVHKTIKRN